MVKKEWKRNGHTNLADASGSKESKKKLKASMENFLFGKMAQTLS